MTDKKDETPVENPKGEVQDSPQGKVYNFTRHNFKVVAKNRSEAEKALEVHLKESKEAK